MTDAVDKSFPLTQIREDTPGVNEVIHFNNCGSALPPSPVLETVINHLKREASIGGYEAADEAQERLNAVYGSTAKLIGSEPDEIAVIENATRAWDMAVYGYKFSPGDRVRLNLTESFDDHSSIDKINFSIEHQGVVNSGLSWSEIQFWELPEFGTGYHQIKINGLDESGNLGGSMVSVAVSPPIAKNLEVIDITSSSTEIEPGMNQFWVTVQNNGASTTEFLLCSDEVCVESLVGPSSYSQNTTAIVLLKVDLDWFETFAVDLTYLDDTNQTIVKHSTSDYHSGMGIGTIELLGIVLVSALAIGWVRSRKGPRF